MLSISVTGVLASKFNQTNMGLALSANYEMACWYVQGDTLCRCVKSLGSCDLMIDTFRSTECVDVTTCPWLGPSNSFSACSLHCCQFSALVLHSILLLDTSVSDEVETKIPLVEENKFRAEKCMNYTC